jgi:UDPglucose 6-dehydrogenase
MNKCEMHNIELKKTDIGDYCPQCAIQEVLAIDIEKEKKKYGVFVVGMWHLGCINAAGMHALGFPVTCFDFDEKVIDDLSKGQLPIYEAGLQELFTDDIKFTKDISQCVHSKFIFITYDIKANGILLEPLLNKLVKELKPYAHGKILVVRSQVTLGVCDRLKKELGCEVCCIPENLRLGTAVDNFFNPGWMVFGLSNPFLRNIMELLFSRINADKLFMGLREAEMIKLAMNCYLATMISFSGEISDICEVHDINAVEVLDALKFDKRVSVHAPIRPGLGFSGGTIERDLLSARKLGPGNLFETIYHSNKKREHYIHNRLQYLFGNELRGKVITFFGATYKTGTNTLRDSPVVKEVYQFRNSDVVLKVFDPLVKEGIDNVQFLKDVSDAKDSDAIVIMTDWDGWKNVDYASLNPKIILDTKNILPPHIKHYGIGVKYG